MKRVINRENLVLIIAITLLVIPSFAGILGSRNGQLIYIGIWLVFMVALSPYYKKLHLFKELTFFISLSVITTLYYSVVIVLTTLNNISFRDLFEPLRPLLYLYAALIPILILSKDDFNPYKLLVKLRWATIIIGVLDLLKFLSPFEVVSHLYCPFKYGSLNYFRFSGSFGYAYNYGFWLLFLTLFTFFEILYLKKKNYYLIIILLLFSLLTGSRSVLLAIFALFSLLFLFEIKGIYNKVKLLVPVFVGGLILYLFMKYSQIDFFTNTIEYIERLFLAILGKAEDGSMTTRTKQLSGAFQNFYDHILIGNGPNKNTSSTVEILMAHYLGTWGIIGLLFYVIVLLTLFTTVKNTISLAAKKEILIFSKANLYWIIIVPIIGLSTPITDQVRVFNLFYLVQGLQFILLLRIRELNIKIGSNYFKQKNEKL